MADVNFKIESYKLKRGQSFAALLKRLGYPERAATKLFAMPYNSHLKKYKSHEKVPEGETVKLPNMSAYAINAIIAKLDWLQGEAEFNLKYEAKLQAIYDLENKIENTTLQADEWQKGLDKRGGEDKKFVDNCKMRLKGDIQLGAMVQCMVAIENWNAKQSASDRKLKSQIAALRKTAATAQTELKSARTILKLADSVTTLVSRLCKGAKKEMEANLKLTL